MLKSYPCWSASIGGSIPTAIDFNKIHYRGPRKDSMRNSYPC